MNLALGPVLLVAASLLLGGLLSLTMLGLLLLSRRPRSPASSSRHAAWRELSWREQPIVDPGQDGTAIVAPER